MIQRSHDDLDNSSEPRFYGHPTEEHYNQRKEDILTVLRRNQVNNANQLLIDGEILYMQRRKLMTEWEKSVSSSDAQLLKDRIDYLISRKQSISDFSPNDSLKHLDTELNECLAKLHMISREYPRDN